MMKKINDFTDYVNVLPYSSEIFGVYQALIGWKSKRIQNRIKKAFSNDKNRILNTVYSRFQGNVDLKINENNMLEGINKLEPGSIQKATSVSKGSFLLDSLNKDLPHISEYNEAVWDNLIQRDKLSDSLNSTVAEKCVDWYKQNQDQFRNDLDKKDVPVQMVTSQLNKESTIAGYLLYLKENKHFEHLKNIFYKFDRNIPDLLLALDYQDPLEIFDPYNDIERAGLSPIGIVHLFRQYFYEFDTFLGTPVSHVWVSPGASVELVEINTRKTTVEKTIETSLETTIKTEESLTEQDEISDAVKQDNKSDTKFGMNATANQGWIGGSATASASIDMGTTQSKSREVAHKHMRQQSDKLSTEIRKNYKSTFKTTTEITDTSSKRYLLANSTGELINYELRRKMRQVGVQVQDIGTYLCWQTYVDDPGGQLGISKLVHLAKSPELGNVPPPESIPNPARMETNTQVDIAYVQTSEDMGDLDESYDDGWETDTDINEGDRETIQSDFGPYIAICDTPGYEYFNIEFDYGGNDVVIRVTNLVEDPKGKIQFGIHLSHVNFRGNSSMRVTAKVTWQPTKDTLDEIAAKNKAKIDDFNEKTRYEHEKAFVEAAKERIYNASNIEPRKFEDLREEERIVVYRSLIQDMLTKNIKMPNDRTRHVVSELLNTIFDIDKMLYFVSPEWWRPRLHESHQALGVQKSVTSSDTEDTGIIKSIYAESRAIDSHLASVSKPENRTIASSSTVTWGGVNENREDNYYITEKSIPAKLGSSLGWLLQLDGDNLRNAFLNAPWVKAVIPIRPGKERAAVNWLQRVNVEDTDGLDDTYSAPPEELSQISHAGPDVTIRDAINHLCDVVSQKHIESLKVSRYPTDEIHDDNKVAATPIDKVFEHGFYPLKDGFRANAGKEQFEIFDQWIEILPTDQIVPVEVKYDPKSGRQI